MLKRALLFMGALGLVVPQLVLAQVHEYTLANGMKLLVKEDHRAPVVVSQVWYKVGSSYEHNGITGISHVLEHMMFKGTKKHGPGEFSRIISENGGSENAFTGADYTAYFQQLEKSRLPISFELESDRMRNLTLLEDEFKKEVAVVMEERRMRTEDKPNALTLEQFYANAFVTSPYHHPIIGWTNDLKNLTVADLRSWYQRWYAPNNATLVVVGDVDAQQVLNLARKYFEPLKAEPIIPVKPRLETEQRGPRRIVVKVPAKLPYLLLGYKVPVLNTASEEWEPYALEVLAGVLSGSGSSRLPRVLVRKQQVAASADVSYDLYSRLGDVFVFDAIPAEGHSIDEVKKAWQDQVAQLKNGLVKADELERIKAQVVADKIYEQDSVFYQAMQMGILETVGLGWQKLDEYPDRIRAVTAEQVQAVAKKYLVDDQSTVAILEPLPLESSQPKPAHKSPKH
jgi:zinc protease